MGAWAKYTWRLCFLSAGTCAASYTCIWGNTYTHIPLLRLILISVQSTLGIKSCFWSKTWMHSLTCPWTVVTCQCLAQ